MYKGGKPDSPRKHREKKNRKKRKEEDAEMENSLPAETANETGEANGGNNRRKRKNREIGKRVKSGKDETVTPNCNAIEGRISGKKDAAFEAKGKLQNSRQKQKKSIECVERAESADAFNKAEDAFERQNNDDMVLTTKLENEDHDTNCSVGLEAGTISFKFSGKPKLPAKNRRKRRLPGKESSQDEILEKKGNAADDEVDQVSSGDEDYSKGMKKWVIQYHQSRPGIKVLQERIDDFITAHEAQEEQARKEKEAQAAEGGWTVVVHHKGRKKTTDAGSGTAVGSVAQAAVLDKISKKKSKEVGLDFYRFQRREAHRNEIMMLQSKFEQDKRRIQEMRAARKFRPY